MVYIVCLVSVEHRTRRIYNFTGKDSAFHHSYLNEVRSWFYVITVMHIY